MVYLAISPGLEPDSPSSNFANLLSLSITEYHGQGKSYDNIHLAICQETSHSTLILLNIFQALLMKFLNALDMMRIKYYNNNWQ